MATTARTSQSPSYHRSYAFGDVGSTRPSRAGARGQAPSLGSIGHTPSYGLQGHTPTIDVREYGAYYPIGGRGSSASRYESYTERKSRGRSTTPGREPVCIRSQSLDRSIGRNARGVDHTTKRLLDFGHISDPTVMRLRTESSALPDKGVPSYLSRFPEGKSHQIHIAAGIDEDTIKKRDRVSRKLEADVQAALKRKADDIYNRHSNTVILEEAMQPIVPRETKRVFSYELAERRPRSTSSIRTFRDEDVEVDHVYHTSRRSTSLNRFNNEDLYSLDNYTPPTFTGRRAKSDRSLDTVSIYPHESDVSGFGNGRGHISVSNASYSPDEVEVIVLPSGQKAVQYSKRSQYGHGDVNDQNSAIKKVMEKTQFMEKSMTTLEDFVRLNRREFPEDTRIYQRIKFFLLDEQQLREIGENPDAEVYGVKITERLVVPEGAEVAHILQRCYNKNDVQIEYGTNTKDIGGRRYSVTDDLETSYRHLKSPLKSKLPRGEDINLARRRKPYEQLADYHIDYEEKDRKRKLISEPYSRSLYTTAGLGYDDIFTPRKGTSYASSVTSEDSGRSVGSSRRKKRFDSAPQFTSKLRPKKCPLGATVRFNASISGLPMPDVQWFRGSRQINEGGRFKITNNYGLVSLEINEVEKDDAGMYTVKATNLEGKCACSASLDVNEADDISPAKPEGIQRPWFTMEMMNAWAEVGNKATLEVQATGRPLPTFKWQKDSFNLSETDSRFKFFADERGNAKLVIWDVKESDTGLYFCIADNKAGKAKCTASLKVVPQGQLSDERRRSRSRETTPVGSRRPGWSRETTPVLDLGPPPEKGTRPYFIQRPPNELLVRQGETMTLKCVVDGDPKPYVTWMKGVRELSYTEHMRVINDGNVYTLQIKSTLETDMGEYIAVAFNPLGKVRSSCYVNIKPRLPDDSDDWELRTYRIDVPEVSVETTSTTEQSNVAPSFTKKLPLETYLDEHENLEIKCKTKEAAPEVHVNKDYKFKVTGDLSLEEKTIRIHREEGEETATVVGKKVEILMTGDKPKEKQEPTKEPTSEKPVDATTEPDEKSTVTAEEAADKPKEPEPVEEGITPVKEAEVKEPEPEGKEKKPVDEPVAKKEAPAETEEPVQEKVEPVEQESSKAKPRELDPEKPVEAEKPVEVAQKEPSPTPTEESSTPTETSTAPTEESSTKTEESSVPTESSAPTETVSNEEVAPVEKQVEEKPKEPSPAPKEPSPAPKEPSPVSEEPSPASKEPSPVPKEPSPAPKEPSPAPKEPSPAPTEGSSAPTESSSTATEDSSVPSEEPEKSAESPAQAPIEEKEAPSAPIEETVTSEDAAPAAQAPEVEKVPESISTEEAPTKTDDFQVKEKVAPIEEIHVEKSPEQPKPVDVEPTEAPAEEEPKPEKKKKRSSIKPEDVAAVEIPATGTNEPTDGEAKKEKKKKKSIKPDDAAANELPDTSEEPKSEKKKKKSSIKPDDVAAVAAAELAEEPKSEKKKKRSSIKPDDVAAVATEEVAEEPKAEKKKKRSSIKPDDVAADAIENGDPEEPKKEKKKKKSIKPDDAAANELPNGEAAPEEDTKKEKKKKKSIKPDDEAANELPPEEEEPKKEKKKKRSSSIKSEDIEAIQNGEAAEEEPKKEKKLKKRASIKPEEAAIMEEVASDTSSKKEKKKKKKGPPSFDAELQDVLTTEGQSVKFTLTITSKPELDSIKWYKDGKKIKKDDHFVIVKDDPSYSLEIIGITQEDIAIYSCTASNEEGSSTTTASIKFQE